MDETTMRPAYVWIGLMLLASFAAANPTFTNKAVNATGASMVVQYSATITYTAEPAGGCFYWLELDNGNKTFYNYTKEFYPGCGGNLAFTKLIRLNETSNTSVSVRIWANDSTGAWNSTYINLTTAAVYVTFFDELTNAPIYATMKNTNGSSETSYVAALGNQQNKTHMLSNNAYLTFANSSYYSRKFYYNDNNFVLTQNVYLINTSRAIEQSIYLINSLGQPITGANITYYKLINSTYVLLGNELTQTGLASIYLKANDNYLISASYQGQSTTSLISASLNQVMLTLGTNQSSINYPSYMGNVSVATYPATRYLLRNTNVTVVFNSSSCTLLEWGLKVYANGTSLINSYSNTTANCGGNYSYLLNLTAYPYPHNFTVVPYFQYAGGLPISVTNFDGSAIVYFVGQPLIAPALNTSLSNTIGKIVGSSNSLTRMIVAVITTAVITSAIAATVPAGAGIVALFMLGVFASISFIPMGYFAICLFIAVMLYIVRVYNG